MYRDLGPSRVKHHLTRAFQDLTVRVKRLKLHLVDRAFVNLANSAPIYQL